VQRFGVGLVIERSLVRLPAEALTSQLGQLPTTLTTTSERLNWYSLLVLGRYNNITISSVSAAESINQSVYFA